MSVAIEFSDVSLGYGLGDELIKVLKSISFSVDSDEAVSIVGPSGSGKTSIIMLAAGLEKSTEGSIKIQNHEITDLKENELSQIRRQNIGIVSAFSRVYNIVWFFFFHFDYRLAILLLDMALCMVHLNRSMSGFLFFKCF